MKTAWEYKHKETTQEISAEGKRMQNSKYKKQESKVDKKIKLTPVSEHLQKLFLCVSALFASRTNTDLYTSYLKPALILHLSYLMYHSYIYILHLKDEV